MFGAMAPIGRDIAEATVTVFIFVPVHGEVAPGLCGGGVGEPARSLGPGRLGGVSRSLAGRTTAHAAGVRAAAVVLAVLGADLERAARSAGLAVSP